MIYSGWVYRSILRKGVFSGTRPHKLKTKKQKSCLSRRCVMFPCGFFAPSRWCSPSSGGANAECLCKCAGVVVAPHCSSLRTAHSPTCCPLVCRTMDWQEGKKARLWGGRFRTDTDPVMEKFNDSLRFDRYTLHKSTTAVHTSVEAAGFHHPLLQRPFFPRFAFSFVRSSTLPR